MQIGTFKPKQNGPMLQNDISGYIFLKDHEVITNCNEISPWNETQS